MVNFGDWQYSEEESVWNKEFVGVLNLNAVLAEAKLKALAESADDEAPLEDS